MKKREAEAVGDRTVSQGETLGDVDDLFVFKDDDTGKVSRGPAEAGGAWKVLSVEDDADYQASIVYSLRGLSVLGRPVELLTSRSAADAAFQLAQHPDIGLILLDVVMEEDDAGLRFVETVRNTLGNQNVRIVLLTGQPGLAPRGRVIEEYDINEYWNKSELHDRLPSIVTTNLRAWRTLTELEQAHLGLQMVVEASQHIADRYDLQHFADTVLQEIAQVIGFEEQGEDGILCTEHALEATGARRIVSSSGFFASSHLRQPGQLDRALEPYAGTLGLALASQSHQFRDTFAVLYFPQTQGITDLEETVAHTLLLKTSRPLGESAIRLLSIFSENVKSGFTKLMLVGRLRALSYVDPSLEIYNRNWLVREIRVLTPAQWQSSTLCLFLLNDYLERTLTFGHAAVEQFMQQLHQYLASIFPPGIPFTRLGHNVLGILCSDSALPEDSLLNELAMVDIPLEGASRTARLTQAKLRLTDVSDDMPAEEVLHLAHTVLYAGWLRQQQSSAYQPELLARIQDDFALEQRLIRALTDGDITIFLQPKVNLADGRVAGFEALARWQQADGSFIPPGVFIPLAETSGLLGTLDLQVLLQAVEVVRRLRELGHHLPVSLNAAWSDLSNPDFLGRITELLDTQHIPADMLEIEITETQAMDAYNEVSPLLGQLRQRGVHVSIDDFGTGHSSLACLARLPADTIKIDRSFVQALGSEELGEHLAEVVVELGRRFNYTVVAEGVETEAQRDRLIGMGCVLGQGYLFARPMPVEEALERLSK